MSTFIAKASFRPPLSGFKFRCRGKLEGLGDSAVVAKQYDEATSRYTAALSLDPASPQDLLVKRSRAYAEKGKWEGALNDAAEVAYCNSSMFVHANEHCSGNQT